MTKINSLPIASWRQKMQWIFNPVGFLENAAQLYPDMFSNNVASFGDGFLFLQNPQALQYILTNDRKIFQPDGELNQFLSPLLGNYSIIMLEGEQHRKRRQLLMPPFHGARMQSYAELIVKLTHQTMNQLSLQRTFTARKAMQEISLQVILESVFGLYEGERAQKLKKLIANMGNVFNSPLTSAFLLLPFLQKDLGPWSPWGYFLRQRNAVDRLLYEEIAERRCTQEVERTDILSLLMSATDEEGNYLTDQELRDELLTLLFAGHETTATAMSWALYWIHKQPEVQEKLGKELQKWAENPDYLALAKLPYLSAVCNETLRIYPVGMLTFPRVNQEEIEILGSKIPAKTVMMGCIYLIHQREDLYPNCKQFKPERFIEKQFSPYEFIPFGGGARRCIGEALAIFEMKLVIATIMLNYELKLASNQEEKPTRRGITLAPKNGVKMILNRKNISIKKQQEMVTV